MRIESANPLHAALADCGVDPARVDAVWDEDCQEEILTIEGEDGAFADAVLSQLAELYLNFPSQFVFTSQTTQDRFQAAVRSTPRMVQGMADSQRRQIAFLKEHGLGEVDPYDPAAETLSSFARRVERACGLSEGAHLSVSEDRIVFSWSETPPSFHEFQKLLAVLQQTISSDRIAITGGYA